MIVPDLKISPQEVRQINNLLVKINGYELSKLHTPCYQPTMIKYSADIRNLTGIQQKDLDIFFNSIVTPEYANVFKILKNDITSILLISIIYYSRQKQHHLAESFYILLAIRFYTNSFSKHWSKYCKEDVWNLALTNLSQKHLFKLKNGLSNSILYLSSIEYANNKAKFMSDSLTGTDVIKFIYMLRHRISQSVRSFANRYYDIENSGQNASQNTTETENINVNLISNSISEKMCTYAQIDNKALAESIIKSNLRRDLAVSIIHELSTIQYKDQVRFTIVLMAKINNLKDLCTKQQLMVRKILGDKLRISNYSVKEEILKISNSMSIFGIKSVNKDQVVSLIANYITLYTKNRIC